MGCRHEREEYREDKKKINQRGGSVKTRELTCVEPLGEAS
jgi:hypothetical protein